jgi:hypothetical protein
MGARERKPALDLGGVLLPRSSPLEPPRGYTKKIVNPGGGCPLVETYTREQVGRRIAFYRELNRRRDGLPRESPPAEKRLALYGWADTTTVRVYMRETVLKISQELFRPGSSVTVENVHDHDDKERGYVLVSVRATETEILSLLEYIRPGAGYYVYDGEKSKYVAGNTAASEFIIAKTDDPIQPARFWRRSQSFIAAMEETSEYYSTFPSASQ